MREVEVLIELFDPIEVATSHLFDCVNLGKKITEDIYYYDPLRDNLSMNMDNKLMECCRVRTKDGKHYITYKVDVYEEQIWQYSNEHETLVEDASTIKNIFLSLGLKELVTIHSVKHTFIKDSFEIVLEEVEGLGNFLEVEETSRDTSRNVKEIKKEIVNFISSLNLNIGEELNSGKPELLLIKNIPPH